jgi:cyanophycinase
VAEGIALDPWDKGIKGDLGFKFRFYRCGDTDGWFSKKNGNTSYTVRNVYLDITPVRLAQPLYKPLMP